MTGSRWNWSRTAVAVGIAALAVGALTSVGTAVSPSGTSASAAQYPPQKVMLCHHTSSKKHPFVTISVSQRAVPAHLRHGDTVGSCPTTSAAKKSKQKQARVTKSARATKGNAVGRAVTSPAPVDTKADRSASTPGRSSTAPGRRASPPHGGTPPGQGGTPPGQDTAREQSPPAEVASPPSPSSSPPGHGASPPHGGTPPGHGGTPPGQTVTPPGQDKK